MTDGRRPGGQEDRSEFDWQSPRWREPDDNQSETERRRRFLDDPSPPPPGAIARGDDRPDDPVDDATE